MAAPVTLDLWRCDSCGMAFWVDPNTGATTAPQIAIHSHPGTIFPDPKWTRLGSHSFVLLP